VAAFLQLETRLRILIALLLVLVTGFACGGGDHGSSPTPAASATPSGSASATATPSGSATASATPVPSGGEPTLPPTGVTYVVQRGDTLYSIAQRFGVTVEAIAQANGISDPTQIDVGQVLIIPGVTATPTGAASATPTPPPSGGPAQVITIGNTSRKTIAFTFDAGSDAGYTAMILDTLKANGLHATFGMTGRFAEIYPELVKRMVNEGHTLINHTYDHKSFTGNSTGAAPLTRAERWDELDHAESIIHDLTGATTLPYFRPPYGDYDASVNEDVGARGYAYNVMWTLDSRGWTGIPAAEIVQRCLDNAQPGAIYIFHVGSASEDGPALQQIIDGLKAQGYAIGDLGAVLAP
jgi:peptidoglycan/xylan/chitin deacetylase (PgdA/CDA1 family)